MMKFILIITACPLFLALAGASTLGLGPGEIKLLSPKTSNICSDGPYQLMGAQNQKVLMVGPNITFHLPSKSKETLASASESECAEDVLSTLENNTLTNIFTTHSCPKKLKHLEAKVVEKLSVVDKTLKYTKESPKSKKVECLFQWSPGHED